MPEDAPVTIAILPASLRFAAASVDADPIAVDRSFPLHFNDRGRANGNIRHAVAAAHCPGLF